MLVWALLLAGSHVWSGDFLTGFAVALVVRVVRIHGQVRGKHSIHRKVALIHIVHSSVVHVVLIIIEAAATTLIKGWIARRPLCLFMAKVTILSFSAVSLCKKGAGRFIPLRPLSRLICVTALIYVRIVVKIAWILVAMTLFEE